MFSNFLVLRDKPVSFPSLHKVATDDQVPMVADLGNAVNDLMALTSFMLKMKILKIHNSLH
jgi:hypothetical protein